MPFQSQVQARAAFGGYLGPEMKAKAREFAHATPGGIKSLPQRVGSARPRRRKLSSAQHAKIGSMVKRIAGGGY